MMAISFAWRRLPLVLVAATMALPEIARADEFTVAAGAGFRRPIVEIASAFEKQTGHKVAQVYGHIGQVLAQARDSGKIDIVCGDRAVIDVAKGLTFSRFAKLGMGRLVIAYRKGLTLARAEDIQKPEFKRIGIPDQVGAIYGKAGRQFLDRSGLAKVIDSRLLPVSTVPQVTSYVVSGEVDAGFINATDAIGAAGNIGGFVEVDQKLYEPVEVSCGLIGARAASGPINDFMAFLETPASRAILTRYGL